MSKSIFPPAVWAFILIVFIVGYSVGFVVGSIAIDRGIRDTVQYLDNRGIR